MGRLNRARLREAGTDRVITPDQAECSAVLELGLRPTYAIVPCDDSEGNIS